MKTQVDMGEFRSDFENPSTLFDSRYCGPTWCFVGTEVLPAAVVVEVETLFKKSFIPLTGT